MYLLLLGLLASNANGHIPDAPAPTQEPVQLHWSKVACVPDEGIADCDADKGPGVGPGVAVDTIECNKSDPADCVCADYWGRYPDSKEQDWIMAMASIFAILMAFGIGANDAANSWATSVGAKAITVGYAVMLCGFFEWAGATSIGYGVSKTIQKGVSKLSAPDCWACGKCDSSITLTMGGSLGALVGASMFLMFASGTAVPVSTTHSIVGGVVGMTLAGAGSHCLNWDVDGGLCGIILSWIVSPVLSGVIAALGYTLSLKYIVKTPNARWRALTALPFMYGVITFACFMMIFLKAKAIKKETDLNTKFILSGVIGAGVMGLVFFFLKPIVIKSLPSETGDSDTYLDRTTKLEEGDEEDEEQPPTKTESTKATICSPTNNSVELVEKKSSKDAGLRSPSIVRCDSNDGKTVFSMSDIVLSADPEKTPLKDWNMESTLRWLTYAEDGRFDYLVKAWALQQVDGECLMIVTDKELKDDLEVTKLGDRKAILRLIEELKIRDTENEENAFKALAAAEAGRHQLDADNADQLDAIFVFRYLLVFTACMESFAHGSNDTANATGPFSAVYQLYTKGGKDCASDEGTVWIMCIAGLFVALGVCTFGYRVIRTIGSNLTIIDFHKGFYIEIGSTMATMIATVEEMPVSTTHCQVGGVIGVGLVAAFNGKGKVSWPLFSKIFLTWVLTLPIAGGVAAIVVLVIKGALIEPTS